MELNKLWIGALALNVLCGTTAHASTPPSIEEFASRPQVEGVSISPDGRYLAAIRTLDGRGFVVSADLQAGKDHVWSPLFGEPDQFLLSWCHWATKTRLLCGLRGITNERGYLFPITRLVAVDADGKNMRVLMQNSLEVQGQYEDQIINWNPGPADTVLIEADEGLSASEQAANVQVYGNVGTHGAPAVFELNVVTGRLGMRQHAREPIRHWVTDPRGQVRLGSGYSEGTVTFWVHLDADSNWRRLTKFEVFSREKHFTPLAISAEDPNQAYAIGPSEGHSALWLIDLKDKDEPKLLFSHPLVDVTNPILARDSRFIGARYDNGYPMMYYADDHIEATMRGFQKLNPGQFSSIVEASLEDKSLLIRSVSDIDSSKFWVFDGDRHQVSKVGAAYPERDTATLAAMRPISYAARDGTLIPAYLSTPPGQPATRLPLIVMPHGGPIARDTWGYFFLRQFLVSRGYAVLQMNFRGSSGYGDDWFFAAHQDWGGLTYDDVVDGAQWAIQQGIAERGRIRIVGWSFGGYLALVGAQRDPGLFRCAVDIAGVSDLPMLIDEGRDWIAGADYRKRQLGTNKEKLRRDSPRLHAAEFTVPLLILHGKRDFQVPFEQSDTLDTALTRAGKPHRFVVVPNADHQFSDVKDRATLLRETEAFLREHLPVAVSP
jgi:dipeptidyl aminopeptidase/acylaminoacyl peptidase